MKIIIIAATDSKYVDHYYHGAFGSSPVPQIFNKISDYYHQSNGSFYDITFYSNISAISANGITGIFKEGNGRMYKIYTYGHYANTADGCSITRSSQFIAEKDRGIRTKDRNIGGQMIWWLAMIIGWFAGILTVGIVVIAISIIIGKKEGC